MKKNTKGFTLIELLAVIVILAIIALIAVPVILNILTKARKSAAEDTCYSVLNAAELFYAEELLDNPTEAFVSTTFTFSTSGVTDNNASDNELEVKGSMPTGGTVIVNNDGTAKIGTPLVVGQMTCTQADENAQVECEPTPNN